MTCPEIRCFRRTTLPLYDMSVPCAPSLILAKLSPPRNALAPLLPGNPQPSRRDPWNNRCIQLAGLAGGCCLWIKTQMVVENVYWMTQDPRIDN